MAPTKKSKKEQEALRKKNLERLAAAEERAKNRKADREAKHLAETMKAAKEGDKTAIATLELLQPTLKKTKKLGQASARKAMLTKTLVDEVSPAPTLPTGNDDDKSNSSEAKTGSSRDSSTKKRKVATSSDGDRADTPKSAKKPKATRDVSDEISNEDTTGTSDDELMDKKPVTIDVQPEAELRAALLRSEERVARAERQVRAISKVRLTDTFIEGQVRTWAKETLWKMCKFVTNEKTMNLVMIKASKHFQVPEADEQHWRSTFAHIVRDGLNQKRNACSQDLRKALLSKCHELNQ